MALVATTARDVHATDARPLAFVPSRGDVVLETLPPSWRDLPFVARTRDAELTPQALRAWLSLAARSGDARLVERAHARLAASPQIAASDRAVANAWIAQHRHDFVAAQTILDVELRVRPDNAGALAVRCGIHRVQGRLREATADCVALALVGGNAQATLCAAELALRRGDSAAGSIALLDRWLAESADADADQRRYVLLLRAETAAQAGAADTQARYGEALAIAPDDVRTLASYARWLRSTGRHREVLRVLDALPAHDGLLLQRTLAAQALGAPEARELSAAWRARRAQTALPELRDDAEFALSIEQDAARALALAHLNWLTQRDREDAELLYRAAIAVDDAPTLAALATWSRAQHIDTGITP